MQNVVNPRWLLKHYPEGMPTLDNWTMDAQRCPIPVLVKSSSKRSGFLSIPTCEAA
jgi:hypothetical protein